MIIGSKDLKCDKCENLVSFSMDIKHLKQYMDAPLQFNLAHVGDNDHILLIKDKK